MEILNTTPPFSLFISDFPDEIVNKTKTLTKNKRRPVLFMKIYNSNNSSVMVYEITSVKYLKVPQYRIKNWRQAGLNKPSYINLNQVIIVKNKNLNYIGKLTDGDILGFTNELIKYKPRTDDYSKIKYRSK